MDPSLLADTLSSEPAWESLSLLLQKAAAFGPLPALCLGGVIFLQAFMLPVPAIVTAGLAAAIYGPWQGFFLALTASTLGAAGAWLAASRLGASHVERLFPNAFRKASGFLSNNGAPAVFSARVLPISFGLVSLTAGALRMPFIPYIAATFAGKAIPTACYCLLYASLDGPLAHKVPVFAGIGGIVVLVLSLLHRLQKKTPM